MRVATYLGNLGNVSLRLRLALASIVLAGSIVGLGVAIGWLSWPVAFLLAWNGGVALQWLFTRRRPWWNDEPGEDIIDRDFATRLVLALVFDTALIIVLLMTRSVSF